MTYQKIQGPFKRHVDGPDRNKVIPWMWACHEFQLLADVPWTWTEKVDGTNIRVIWDGHKPVFGGRTDNAQIPAKLVQYLTSTFTEELLEQNFGGQPVTLYGEGYGAGIQSGGLYRPDQAFILFDVRISDWWLRPMDVAMIAGDLGIQSVPDFGDVPLTEMIRQVAVKKLESELAEGVDAEGLVGTCGGLLDRSGTRIIVKLKTKDLFGVRL
jgi:hypothetical protein